jgi:hypothetical protein
MRKQKRAAGVAQGGLNPEFKALVPQKKKKKSTKFCRIPLRIR